MTDRMWCELLYPCKTCRRVSKKKLKKCFPIKTRPKTIWVFADPLTLSAKLNDLGIDVENLGQKKYRQKEHEKCL